MALNVTSGGHSSWVNGMAAFGRLAISASDDKTLKVWDIESPQKLHQLRGHTSDVNGVVVTSDGQLAISASSDRTLKEWELWSGRCLTTFHVYGPLLACAMATDGVTIVAAG